VYILSREMGIPMAEIGRNLGVGTSAIAMAIREKSGLFNLKVLNTVPVNP